MSEDQPIDFSMIFKTGFPKLGLPNPIKDGEFRRALVESLNEYEADAQKAAVPENEDKFVFSEKEYKHQLELLDAVWAADMTKNRAANWILTAWEKGYIKNVKQG